MRNILLTSFIIASVVFSGAAYYKKNNLDKTSPNAKVENKANYAAMPVKVLVKDQAALKSAITELGVKAVIKKLVDESNGGTIFDCHQEAHTIGRVGYGIHKEKAFGQCDASCHSGCYHGAMETFLNEKGTLNLAENITSVCGLFNTSFGKFECLHGVGHGLLAYLDYDMPGTVKECKTLGDWFSTVSCYGGMFMENVLTGQGLGASEKLDHETEWVNQTDPHFPCNALDKNDYDLEFQCYQMQTSWMLTLYNFDFKKVRDACLKAPANMVPVCFKSFGRDAAGNTLRSPEGIMRNCALIQKEQAYYNECMVGAVNVIIDFWGPELKGQASELCKLPVEPAKSVCYSTLISRIQGLWNEKDKRAAVCNTFEEKYKNSCLSSI